MVTTSIPRVATYGIRPRIISVCSASTASACPILPPGWRRITEQLTCSLHVSQRFSFGTAAVRAARPPSASYTSTTVPSQSLGRRGGSVAPRRRRTQAERSAATRAALIAAARELFAARGFADTGREEIVKHAGVTRGALHHHFGSKTELFRAVFEDVERELTERVAGTLTADSPMEGLRRGCEMFLEAATDPAVQRIVLTDAPSVLGWRTWREIDARYGLGLAIGALDAVMDAGQIERRPVEPLAHMLLAALTEAAMLVASSPDPQRTRGEVDAIVDRLLSSF
ncbi:MAG: TetR family transcriptional regulator [Streptosporangiales bacterium]|nr:TetR family transcriptional regulator [Streptosporangiales bacterium]